MGTPAFTMLGGGSRHRKCGQHPIVCTTASIVRDNKPTPKYSEANRWYGSQSSQKMEEEEESFQEIISKASSRNGALSVRKNIVVSPSPSS